MTRWRSPWLWSLAAAALVLTLVLTLTGRSGPDSPGEAVDAETGRTMIVDERTLACPDYRGNRQYISVGNLATQDRACLFFMDYSHRRRLKIFVTLLVAFVLLLIPGAALTGFPPGEVVGTIHLGDPVAAEAQRLWADQPDRQPLLGVIYDPTRGELFTALAGRDRPRQWFRGFHMAWPSPTSS